MKKNVNYARRRKIVESVGLFLMTVGITCLFLFCSTDNQHDLNFGLATVGLVTMLIGTYLVVTVQNIKAMIKAKRKRKGEVSPYHPNKGG